MGPLAGIRVVELPAIGPAPFAGMVLAGLGAEVVRIERPGAEPLVAPGHAYNIVRRDRTSVMLDLKQPLAVEAVLRLVAGADALIEGWRPGVAERLGLGPKPCGERNPRLVYGRMTGWGQDGPRSRTAGHDINYVALSGVLNAIGRAGEPPLAPLNLLGDYGGGGMLLALGVLAGIIHAKASGRGQVVDAAMTDGVATLAAAFYGYVAGGAWSLDRGTNLLDSGAPFYDVYETSDGGFVAVGALEPQFYAAFVAGLGLEQESLPPREDRTSWPELRETFAAVLARRSRDEWAQIFADTDARVTPVLSFAEAAADPHNRARSSIVELDGIPQPAPAPRFTESPAAVPRPPAPPGADTDVVLRSLGFDGDELDILLPGANAT
ncbi:MAG: CoA transferase [Actinobacteria bacterium]|nr:CoA transferase [Actinomycetota bacterium]